MSTKRYAGWLGLAAALLAISAVHAQPVQVAQAAFTHPTVLNFNGLASEVKITNQFAGQGVTFSGGAYVLTDGADLQYFPGATAIASDWIYPPDGTGLQALPITVTFTSVQNLIGSFYSGNPTDIVTITTFLNGVSHGSASFVLPGGNSAAFFGVSDPAGFNSITINMSGPINHFIAFNNFEFQSTPSVPALSGWALLLLACGLGGLGIRSARTPWARPY